MAKIRTVYVTNHSHTDIGFTDYQDLCFEQHNAFIDEALDLCDATSNYPVEARYRWTCEVTGTAEKYFNAASKEQIERFHLWQDRGGISVAGMQYNMTPLLNAEQMVRSLLPVRRLRDDYGVKIEAAMQCDVNGVSWMFTDLLLDMGINFLTMSVNPSRGDVPKPMPTGFWWETPTGRKMLTWNGFHYLFGRNIAKLADWRFVENDFTRELDKLERDGSYQFDFMYCQSTHPIRVDNGPPDIRLANFVRDWNAAGHEPRVVLTNPSEFGKMLNERFGDNLETWRGDWTDWWCDDVASSAFETGMNRTTHELLEIADYLAAIDALRTKRENDPTISANAYENATLYDEHTWGGFASIERPQTHWVKAQWNRKAGFAYKAFSEAHAMVAEGTDRILDEIGEAGSEGMFNLGDIDPDVAYPHTDESSVLVVNTLPWNREMTVDEPEPRGHAAPAGMLDCFFPRGVGWGGFRPQLPVKRFRGLVPANGYAVLTNRDRVESGGLTSSEYTIENEYYRIRVDPSTGGLAEWYDRDLNHDFAGRYNGWRLGQFVYEWVDSPEQRDALFYNDFSAENFGTRYTDTPFVRETVTTVRVNAPEVHEGRASITIEFEGPGIERSRCDLWLSAGDRTLGLDFVLNKKAVTEVESVYVAFPFGLGTPIFRADINGLAITPERDQLPETVRDWYPIGRWIDVSDGDFGVTVVPLDAPLMQLGGITTGRWAQELQPEGPNLMSWALNNHWMVNFKASQSGEIPLRYRLTTHRGACDDNAAEKYAREQSTPIIAVRDVNLSKGGGSDQYFSISGNQVELIHTKPADFGGGVIMRLRNMGTGIAIARIRVSGIQMRSASVVTPDERGITELPIDGESVNMEVAGLSTISIRIVV